MDRHWGRARLPLGRAWCTERAAAAATSIRCLSAGVQWKLAGQVKCQPLVTVFSPTAAGAPGSGAETVTGRSAPDRMVIPGRRRAPW